jgi:hypothetical protein
MNVGKWLYKKLFLMKKSQVWLYRRARLTDGSIQRWANGQDPGTEPFLRVCKVLAVECGVTQLDIVGEYLETK